MKTLEKYNNLPQGKKENSPRVEKKETYIYNNEEILRCRFMTQPTEKTSGVYYFKYITAVKLNNSSEEFTVTNTSKMVYNSMTNRTARI